MRLLSVLLKAWAFILRDLAIEMSYRSAFVLQFMGVFVSVGIWFFLSDMFHGMAPAMKGVEGGEYFPFILVGVAFYHYLTVALTAFASRVRNEQLTGTLEAMLVSPTRTPTLILASSLWDFVFTSFRVVVYLAVGVAVAWLAGRPIAIHASGVFPSVVVLGLTILSFCGIGIIVASSVIYFKRGESINSFVTSASALIGGVFYPTQALPAWLQSFSSFLPITYALRGIRRALLSGASLSDLIPELQVLSLFALVLVPLGLVVFRWSLKLARRDGTLVQY
ncbi:MAG TPA: ABC transporter permease [Verrucomicrobiae bacterium]|nr:ABC transporter permease [Verrucomicrobiae bacterium]